MNNENYKCELYDLRENRPEEIYFFHFVFYLSYPIIQAKISIQSHGLRHLTYSI